MQDSVVSLKRSQRPANDLSGPIWSGHYTSYPCSWELHAGGRQAMSKHRGGGDKYLWPGQVPQRSRWTSWRIRKQDGRAGGSKARMQRSSGNQEMAEEWEDVPEQVASLQKPAVRWKERTRAGFLLDAVEPGGSPTYPRFEGCLSPISVTHCCSNCCGKNLCICVFV